MGVKTLPRVTKTDKHRRLADMKTIKPKSTVSSKDSASAISTDAQHILRDLRIFSHFVPPGKFFTSGNKVEIHPAVSYLALQFSEFRIVGGNARCIATLAALKEVQYS